MLRKLGCALGNIGRSLMSRVSWRCFCKFSTQVVGNLELRIYVKKIQILNFLLKIGFKRRSTFSPFKNSFNITICDNNTKHTGKYTGNGKPYLV
jgi:hypothetical protein